ncbi:MAG: dimethylsulfonioproprionate lyase family protein [Bacillota bacterium]
MKFTVSKAGSVMACIVPGDGGLTQKTRVVCTEQGMPTKTLFAGFLELPPGVHGALHDHNMEELYYILSGYGWVECDGERKEIAQGDVVWLSADVKHRAMNGSATEPLKLLYVCGADMNVLKDA